MSIRLRNISQSFGKPVTNVLFDINLEIHSGEFVALTGRSGSGKSTLLYIASALEKPTEGNVELSGRSVSSMSRHELHQFRNLNMGFVFQFHYLLPELTALENILMPTLKTGSWNAKRERALFLLNEFGLISKQDRFSSQMSGGEQQRVAIARALIMEPKYLFADEPTGNLDSVNGQAVMNLLEKVNRENRTTIVMVTHDQDFASRASRRVNMVDGRISS